jgi:transcriptional regulator
MKTTGEIIKRKREELGITAEKLGEMTGVTQAYVTMSENNSTKPSKAFLEKIKDILHITSEEDKEIKEYEEFRRLPEKFQKRLLLLEKGLLPQYKALDTRGKNQFEKVIEESSLMFNDETISEEDKEKVLMAIQSAFFDAKQRNKRKK